jgi:hypothetical protein
VSYGPTGSEFVADNCSVFTPHDTLECNTSAGAGRTLKITVVVDGLVSAAPVTAYKEPTIEAVSAPPRGASVGFSTRGGEPMVIEGTDFGPYLDDGASYLDAVGYGGVTLPAALCNMSEPHTEITCQTLPGVGANLHVDVIIGNQPSTNLGVDMSYAEPVLLALLQTQRKDPSLAGLLDLQYKYLAAEVPTEGAVLRLVGFDLGGASVNTSVSADVAFDAPSEFAAVVSYEDVACDAQSLQVARMLASSAPSLPSLYAGPQSVPRTPRFLPPTDASDLNFNVPSEASTFNTFYAAAGSPANLSLLTPLVTSSL